MGNSENPGGGGSIVVGMICYFLVGMGLTEVQNLGGGAMFTTSTLVPTALLSDLGAISLIP